VYVQGPSLSNDTFQFLLVVPQPLSGPWPPHYRGFVITLRHSTFNYSTNVSVEASWNVMAHAQKPDFVFRRKERVHLNRRGATVQSTTGNRGVCISGSNAGYTTFWGSVKSTGCPLHSPVSPFTSSPVRHHVPSHFNRCLLYDGPCIKKIVVKDQSSFITIRLAVFYL